MDLDGNEKYIIYIFHSHDFIHLILYKNYFSKLSILNKNYDNNKQLIPGFIHGWDKNIRNSKYMGYVTFVMLLKPMYDTE